MKFLYVKVKLICIVPIWKCLKRDQVWHVLSKDLTVLRAHATFIRRRNEPYLPLPPCWSWYSFTDPKGWKTDLAWATRTVSKQLAQDCYAMFIAAANQSKTFMPHWTDRLSGLYRATTRQLQQVGRELTTSQLQVWRITIELPRHLNNNWSHWSNKYIIEWMILEY